MTAADRPSVTDNARAEAERRYPSDVADRGLTYPTGAVREHSQAAFVAGAEWAAGRAETTTATDEAGARALEQAADSIDWEWETYTAPDGIKSIRPHGAAPSTLLRERAARLRGGDPR